MNRYPYGLLQTNAPASSWMAQIPTQPVALPAPSYTDEADADAIFETFIDYNVYSPADLPHAVASEGYPVVEQPQTEVKVEPFAECLRGTYDPTPSMSPRSVSSLLSSPRSSAASTSAPTTPSPEEQPAATASLKDISPPVAGLFDFDPSVDSSYGFDTLGEHAWADFTPTDARMELPDAAYRLGVDFPDYPPAYTQPTYIPPAYALPIPSALHTHSTAPPGTIFRTPSPSPAPESPLSPLPAPRAASPPASVQARVQKQGAARTQKAAKAARAKPYAKDGAARRKGKAKEERARPDAVSPDALAGPSDAARTRASAPCLPAASTSAARSPSPSSSLSSLSPSPPPAPTKSRAKTQGVTRTAKSTRAHASKPYAKAPAARKARAPPAEEPADELSPTGRPSRAAARESRNKVAACLRSEQNPEPASSRAPRRGKRDDEDEDSDGSYTDDDDAVSLPSTREGGDADRGSRMDKVARCAECGKGFTRTSDQKRHRGLHTRPDPKPCPCPFKECTGRFSRPDAAKRHVNDSCDVAKALRARGRSAAVDWVAYEKRLKPQ